MEDFLSAIQSLNTQQFDEFSKLLLSSPKNEELLGKDGMNQFRKFYMHCLEKKFDKAIPIIRKLSNKHQGDLKYILQIFRGSAYVFSNNYDKIIAYASEDIEKDPKDGLAHIARASVLIRRAFDKGNDANTPEITLSLKDIDESLPLMESDEAELYRLMSVTLRMERKEYTAALRTLNELVAQDANEAVYYKLRGDCFSKLDVDAGTMRGENSKKGIRPESWQLPDGKERAIEDLNRAIALKPESFSFLNNRALLKSELFDFEGAWEDAELASKNMTTKKQKEELLFHMAIIGIREKKAFGTFRGEPVEETAE